MGQKTHPVGFRLGITHTHQSHWYANAHNYSKLLQEDFAIRQLLNEYVLKAGIACTNILRKSHQIELELHTARPGILVGRSGAGLEALRTQLQTRFPNLLWRISLIEISNPDANAVLLAQWLAQQLEKRMAFRRAIRQAMARAQKVGVKGIKIQLSGRLNGAEIARSEWVRHGQIPLQTLRTRIDYATATAFTTYGVIGVKVWINHVKS
jgi:small subunit ribosomal protein S3|uniref:Small ribosomal subunit protein uS3c n=1 Tax=Cyanidiaceae sp. MX-AZ01 TaxID=1503164 RepID=A0A060A563_9RHOD|nr:ribosomal protein S3 [Cyanidiaceae sp. MX-AZ01]UNJ15398.1 ribosomal protein S3 [Cyanidioschyzonaceae sp. 1]